MNESTRWTPLDATQHAQARCERRVRELLQKTFADLRFRELPDRWELPELGAFWIEFAEPGQVRVAAQRTQPPEGFLAWPAANDRELGAAVAAAVGWLQHGP